MGRQFTLSILCFLGCSVALSQNRDETRIIRQAGTAMYSFDDVRYFRTGSIPFREIIIVDQRFDTTKLGYVNSNQKVKLGKGWTDILNSYFKNNLDPNAERSLVIFIKSFWMQKGIVEKIVHKKIVTRDIFGSSEFGEIGAQRISNSGSVTCNLEIFSKTGDDYQALYRIDTFFLNPITSFNRARLREYFFLPFDSVFQKTSKTDIQSLLSKRKKHTADEVANAYQKRRTIPLLTEAAPRKGIYYTFKDFRENKPGDPSFRFREGKLSDELYSESGQLITDYWGFSDGTDLYIKAGFSAFKAVRQHDTFEIFGSLYVANYHDNPVPGGINLRSTAIDRKILQLDMETGGFY